MKIKTNELTGSALDWAVAEAQKIKVHRSKSGKWMTANYGEFNHRHGAPWYQPSTDWAQGGPIIEREKIRIRPAHFGLWCALYQHTEHVEDEELVGPTPLIAAMRCYVASKLGDEVEIPKELT